MMRKMFVVNTICFTFTTINSWTSDACWPFQPKCTQPFHQFDTLNWRHEVTLVCYTQTACCLAVLCRESNRRTEASYRPAASKLKVDTLNIFFNSPEAVIRKPCFRRPMLMCFSWFIFCRFGHAFFFYPMEWDFFITMHGGKKFGCFSCWVGGPVKHCLGTSL